MPYALIAHLDSRQLQIETRSAIDRFFAASGKREQDACVRTAVPYIEEKLRRRLPLSDEERDIAQLAIELREERRSGGIPWYVWIIIILFIKAIAVAIVRYSYGR